MAQNVISLGCDPERSRSSVKVNNCSISTQPSTHKYACKVSSKRGQGKKERKKEIRI